MLSLKYFPENLLTSLFQDDNDTFVQTIYNNYDLINFSNINGESLLHYAAFYGLTEKFISLINMGAIPQKTKLKNSLLHYAALGGKDFYLFNQLIKDNYDLLERNILGITPFHFCSDPSSFSSAYRYLQMKNYQFKAINVLDNQKNNPAHIAMKHKNIEVYNFLLKEEPLIEHSINLQQETPTQVEIEPYTFFK